MEKQEIEKTFEEKVLERLDSLEHRVGILMSEVKNHSSTEIGTGKKTIYLKGRVDDLETELRTLKPS